jgi:hypothetical protein
MGLAFQISKRWSRSQSHMDVPLLPWVERERPLRTLIVGFGK